MQYEFRDKVYQGKNVRFVKPLNFNSHGDTHNLSVAQCNALKQQAETESPESIIVVMKGGGTIAAPTNDFMGMLIRDNPITWDDYYDWTVAGD